MRDLIAITGEEAHAAKVIESLPISTWSLCTRLIMARMELQIAKMVGPQAERKARRIMRIRMAAAEYRLGRRV